MDNNMLERAELALAKKKKRSVWLRIVSVLGCVVVFCTTYALILPAITMTRQTVCGLEEHTHTVQCYETRTVEGETVLSCGAEEELHTHSDSCYDSNHVPVCGYANYYVHVYNDRCYEGDTLVCDLQEIKEHTHGGNCFESEQKLICTLEEGGETHTHDDACYSQEKTLICELEEGGEVHVHEDGCYAREQTLTCGREEAEGVHAHSGECYTTESRLVCEKEEKTEVHTHTDECYNTTSTLTCEKEEVTETHTHGEECHETVETLTCRKTEVKLHTHGSSCLRTEEDGSETLVCTQVQVLEHVHSDSCFAAKTEQVVICGLEEHSHVDECYLVEETTGPTENETIPTEGEAVPTEGETTPDGDENAPTKGETTPIEDEDEPTEGETMPAEDENAPTEGETMPAEDENDPTEGETVPVETVPAEETTPVGDGTISAEVEETAPVYLSDGTTTVVASGTHGDNLTWTITELDGVQTLTISGEGMMHDYKVGVYNEIWVDDRPWGSESYPVDFNIEHVRIGEGVTGIGDCAFSYLNDLTSVEIPDSVTSIGNSAFAESSSLTNIEIPDSVTSIGGSAFSGCSSLTSVTIPDSVTSIGSCAFIFCDSLTSVKLPAGFVKVEYGAFLECDRLSGILDIEQSREYYVDEQGVAYYLVGDIAYVCYKPAGSNLPDSIAVTENGKVYTVLPYDVIVIDAAGENVEWIVYDAGTERCLDIHGAGAMEDYYNGFTPWSSYKGDIDRAIIGEGITSIGDHAFSYCTSLTNVTIGDGVSSIGAEAFYGCSSLTSIEIPDGVTSIGSYAFSRCSALETIYLDASQMTSVGSGAFSGCSNLREIIIGPGVDVLTPVLFKTVGSGMKISFEGPNYFTLSDNFTESDAKTYLGEDLSFLRAGYSYYVDENGAIYLVDNGMAYYLYSPMSNYIAPQTIPTEAFDGTTRPVCSAKLPDVVKRDGDLIWMVYGDRLMILGECEIPNYSETGAPWYAYREQIEEIVLADTITGIGNFAFNSFSQVTEIEIPRDAATVSTSAFRNCTSLRNFTVDAENTAFSEENSILYNADQTVLILCPPAKRSAREIPATVTTIGNYAFAYNDSLTGVTLPDALETIEANAFYDCDGLTSVTIPGETVTVGENAFYDCDGLTTVRVTAADAEIGKNAFYDCDAVTAVTVTSQASAIGEGAFRSCDVLQKLDVRSETVTLGEYAFYDCTDLEQISLAVLPDVIPAYAFGNCSAMTTFDVPAGITEFTVPAAIPAADEGEETVPVIGVATGALEAATDLMALVFESPKTITSLADGCMANCPTLLSINGFTTVREAKEIFANDNLTMGEGILENTGLTSELEEWLSQRQTSEDAINVETDGVTVTVTTSTEKNTATEGNMAFYTG